MTSPAQLAANRRNARKSTGPKTAGGKAAIAQNALKHGLTARHFICSDEGLRDFMSFAAALREALAPADSVEEQLAERIISLSWRLRRTARAERGIVDTWPSASHETYLFHHENGMARMLADHPSRLMALSRYEASLDRALGRAYALLDRRQARRRGEAVPAPVTVLVEGLPDSANSLDLQAKNENCETKPMSGGTTLTLSAPETEASVVAVPELSPSPDNPANRSSRLAPLGSRAKSGRTRRARREAAERVIRSGG